MKTPVDGASERRERSLRALVAGAEITAATRVRYPGAFFGRRHVHPDISHISFIIAGRARVSIAGRNFEAADNDAVFVRSGQAHQSFPAGENQWYELLEVKFRLPGEPGPDLPPVTALHRSRPEFISAFNQLVGEFHMNLPCRQVMMRSCLARLVIILHRNNELKAGARPSPGDAAGARKKQLVARALSFLHEHYPRPVTLASLAAELHVSPSHLGHAFREITGITPIAYLERYRLGQAVQLMEKTDWKLARVAEATGFRDQYYFSRRFRKSHGLPPRRYMGGHPTRAKTG